MRKLAVNFFKGLIMGAAMLVPGVSGGTTAIILGIYQDLISAVSNLFSNIKSSLTLLLSVCIGGIAGMMLFSQALLYVTKKFENPMMYLFMGAIIGSIPLLFKKSGVTRISQINLKCVSYLIIGIVIILLIELLPRGMFEFSATPGGYILLAAAGIVTAIALVLPGISVSYMLLVLGVYSKTLTAIECFDFAFLLPLFVSVIAGVLLTTRVLEKAMNDYSRQTFMIISGFVVGSVFTVFPGFPVGLEWLVCPVMFIAGFVGVLRLSSIAE